MTMTSADCKRDVLAALRAEPEGYRYHALLRVVKWVDTDIERALKDLEGQGQVISEPWPRPQSKTRRYRLPA